jgi:predicted nucleic acid-binding protein
VAWIDALKGKVVGLDTAPLIYFIEQHPNYTGVVNPFFEALEHRELRVVTSTITLLEVLVAPMKQNDAQLAAKYRNVLLKTRDLSLISLTQSIAEEAARLRAVYRLHMADAIEIATALNSRAAFFLTNDKRLSSVSGIEVLVLDELKAQPNADKLKKDS